ncbi:Bis(5'-nucleosyl)-tetraphosphatase [symmetrical] [Buchnera aphidicola (Tetraneura ulmi)]|uniref:symmetrical bis(5'-nucleosyl)-tetraphosphatase n=1 Tax=Buchnera aphidicola TaxID=9 RepID=UPI003463A46A
MATYIVGDVHGCFEELQVLINISNFNREKDTIYFTGDLVARGSLSLQVLQYVYSLGKSAKIVLGNHDLYLLSVYFCKKKYNKLDNFDNLLKFPRIDKLMNWLKGNPFLYVDKEKKMILSHAGIHPKWNISTALKCSKEIEDVFSTDCHDLNFLKLFPNNDHYIWNNNLKFPDRIFFIMNVFTRMRFCYENDSKLDFFCKSDLDKKNNVHLYPWFKDLNKIDKKYKIIFGHWSSLNKKSTDIPKNVIPLDTGCCWGGELTMYRLEDKSYFKTPCFSLKKNKLK